MDEQKRLILAIVLSVLVLVGYQAFFVKAPDPTSLPRQVETRDTDPSQVRESTPNVSDYSTQAGVLPQAAQPAKKNYRTIQVSTPLYNIAISEYGAAVKSFELKQYKATNKKDSPLKQLVPHQIESGTLFFDLEGQSIAGLKDAVYTAKTDALETSVVDNNKTIEFILGTSQGIVVKKVFTFRPDSYMIDCDIIFQNGSSMPLNDSLVISTPGFFDEETKKKSRFAFVGPMASIDGKYTAVKPDDIEDQDTYPGAIDWTGYTEQYFMTAITPQKPETGLAPEAKFKLSYADDRVVAAYVQKMDRLEPGKQGAYSFSFYMGPKSHAVLSKDGAELKNAVNFGFFNIIAKPLLITMNMIHNVIPNYGVAIILLTIFIKLLFWPLGTKSYKSMNEMKKVQPLMMELREKYKDDKQRMNQEVMGLYKTYKVNPASGCLPLLAQMPIFFALYRMLYQAIELRHAPFFGWITDLSAPDRLFDLNFAIPMMQAPYGIPMLTLLMGASFLLQQKMTPTAGDPMQAKMMMLMPIFMTVLFINFPAGLVLYMFVNNIISMGQQYYIQKKFS
jgi:YidC/Oxa1 family membrane protein insertase